MMKVKQVDENRMQKAQVRDPEGASNLPHPPRVQSTVDGARRGECHPKVWNPTDSANRRIWRERPAGGELARIWTGGSVNGPTMPDVP